MYLFIIFILYLFIFYFIFCMQELVARGTNWVEDKGDHVGKGCNFTD